MGAAVSKGKSNEGVRQAHQEEALVPTPIKVLHMEVDVKLHNAYYNADETRVYGEWDERRMTINLDSDAHIGVMKEALLHELLHAILSIYDKDSEELVRVLSPALMQVLKDNPRLVEFLLSQRFD